MIKSLEYYINQNKYNKCPTFEGENQHISPPRVEDKNNIYKDILTLTQKLEALKTLIDNKTIESGSLPWDNIPTQGHTNYILNSDSLYQYFQQYYTKEKIDEIIQNLWENLIQYSREKQPIDNILSEYSENPVQNKIITYIINTLQPFLISGTNIKTINGESLLGEGNIEIQSSENLPINNQYVTKQELNNYAAKAEVEAIINRLPKHVFLTQEQYDALNGVYAKNTLYFIVESVDEDEIGYAFGDQLPIMLGWTFGRKFPITLS